MVTTSLPLRIAFGLCLIAAACSGSQGEKADPGVALADGTPSHETDEPGGSESAPADSSGAPNADNDGSAISVDIIGALFPTSYSDADSLIDLYSVFGRVWYLYHVDCMRDAGFEIDLPESETSGFHNRFYDFPNLEAIAKQGFSVSYEESDPLENVPIGLQDHYMETQRACDFAYVDPSDQIWDASDLLVRQWYEEIYVVDSSPEIVEQFEIWAKCMTDGGHPVESHESFFPELDSALFTLEDSLDPADWEKARIEELAAAELYVACMRPLEEVRQPMRDDARREFLEDNAEEVRAIEELANRLILEVQQQ